ncbi:MAG: SGNH/GDSL hydrolase family protein [Brucella anthropi]
MSVFTKKAVDIFAPVRADGTPRQVSNLDAQVWGSELETLVGGVIAAGGKIYASKALMDADLSPSENTPALVIGDPVAANNGLYRKIGVSGTGSWQRLGDVPGYQIIPLTNTGAGTANALRATSALPVPQADRSAILLLNVTATNTGAMTLSVNAEGARPLRTNSGQDINPAYVRTGMVLALVKEGVNYRLLSDVASAAIQEAAEAAKVAAEAAQLAAEHARDLAANYANDALAGGMDPGISARAAVPALEIPEGITHFRTAGFSVPGDGGAALYNRVASEPSHAGKVQSADGAWWEINEFILKPEQFGAFADEDAVSVRAALDDLKTVVNAKGLPWVLDQSLDIGTAGSAFSLSNCVGGVGAEITGNVYLGPVTGIQGRPIKVHFNNGSIALDYVLDPKAINVPSEKMEFLTAGDVFDAKYTAVDMSAIETSYWTAGAGDTFTLEAPNTKTSDTVGWLLSSSTSRWHIAWCPVTGGDEVSAAFSRTDFLRGVFIRTTAGFEYLYAQPDATVGIFGIKVPGSAPSENNYTIPNSSENIAYRFRNAELSVRLKSPDTYSILANGSEIVAGRKTFSGGNILAIGYGVFENGTASPTVKNMVRARKVEQHGLFPVNVGILGNSISGDNVYGRWDSWLRKYLDMSMGLRVTNVVNVAVSGVGSAGILTQSTDPLLNPCNCALIVAPGTNDTQFNVGVSTTLSNISTSIDNLVNAGKKCILMIEPMWYVPSMAGGKGQTSQNHEMGAERRTALRRLAAQKGIPCVDLQQVSGLISPAWLSQMDVIDPTLRDNIHPSALFFKAIALAAAQSILEAYAPKPSRVVRNKVIPSSGAYSWLGSEYTAGTRVPAYSVSSDGIVSLTGLVTHNAATSPSTVLTVPAGLRPERSQDMMLSLFNGSANSVVFGSIDMLGVLSVYSVPSAGILRLDGTSWYLPG